MCIQNPICEAHIDTKKDSLSFFIELKRLISQQPEV